MSGDEAAAASDASQKATSEQPPKGGPTWRCYRCGVRGPYYWTLQEAEAGVNEHRESHPKCACVCGCAERQGDGSWTCDECRAGLCAPAPAASDEPAKRSERSGDERV